MFDLIQRAQSGDRKAMELLLQRFHPLLHKYSKKMYDMEYEDAYSEMSLRFIELIQRLQLDRLGAHTDGILVNYIAASLQNAYINLFVKNKRQASTVSFEDLSVPQRQHIENLNAPDAFANATTIDAIFPGNPLTKHEKQVLSLLFLQGYNAAEVARLQHVSRQSINQTKNRALLKLKDYVIHM